MKPLHHFTPRQHWHFGIAETSRLHPPSPFNGERGENTPRPRLDECGVTLIECLVYISLVFVILGMATVAFYRCFDNMKALRRNSDDITQALNVGELWRADLRAATKPVRFETDNQLLHIPQRDHEVAYKFADAQVWRRTSDDANWVIVLPKVEKSQMQLEKRNQVNAWQWELELKSLRHPSTTRPLFTFIAVPGTAATP